MCKGLTVEELLYGRATRKFVGFTLLYGIMTCVLCLTAIAHTTYCTLLYVHRNDRILLYIFPKSNEQFFFVTNKIKRIPA